MFPTTVENPIEIKLQETCLIIEDLPHICKMCFRKDNLQHFDELVIGDTPLSNVFVQLTSIEVNAK